MSQGSYHNEIDRDPGARQEDMEPDVDHDDDLPIFHLSTPASHENRGQSGCANSKKLMPDIKELPYRMAYEFVHGLHARKGTD